MPNKASAPVIAVRRSRSVARVRRATAEAGLVL
jgi:hypothetical protein